MASNWEAIAPGPAQPLAEAEEEPVPLWRGHGMQVRFKGLESA